MIQEQIASLEDIVNIPLEFTTNATALFDNAIKSIDVSFNLTVLSDRTTIVRVCENRVDQFLTKLQNYSVEYVVCEKTPIKNVKRRKLVEEGLRPEIRPRRRRRSMKRRTRNADS